MHRRDPSACPARSFLGPQERLVGCSSSTDAHSGHLGTEIVGVRLASRPGRVLAQAAPVRVCFRRASLLVRRVVRASVLPVLPSSGTPARKDRAYSNRCCCPTASPCCEVLVRFRGEDVRSESTNHLPFVKLARANPASANRGITTRPPRRDCW
jgi:hypothetical protein